MAKAKKQELTLEEKLEQALVPENEQPYKVPSNWVWTNLNSVCDFERGITFPASAKNKEKAHTLIACLRTANVQENLEVEDLLYIDRRYMKNNSNKFVRDNDIIMSSANSRELVGKVSFVEKLNEEMTFGGFLLTIRARNIVSKYLFYMLRLQFLSGKFMGESTQTTNIANINTTTLGRYAFPLPPIAEQQRILDRIESLFEKLDKAKELAQNALDTFETRKAAILYKAFTGELTAKWREKNNVAMDSWKEKHISDICEVVRGGSPRPAGDIKFYNGNIPFMKVADITKNDGPYVYTTENSIKEAGLKKTRLVDANTLLLTNSGATLGVPAICTFQTTFNDGIAAFLNLDKRSLKFFYYFFTSKTLELRGINKGAAQPNLNTMIIGSIKLNIPSIIEQQEIVRILDNFFEKEQKANELCDVIDKIDLIKKSILARAFRGELGTNDPSEESAIELLKKCL